MDRGEMLLTYRRGAFIIEARAVLDESPDFSFLGEYSDTAGKWAIDREARGERGRHEFRYFNPAYGEDNENSRTRRAYQFRDYHRMEAYNRGAWAMLGIVASVTVEQEGWAAPMELGRASCWGYESDAGAYLKTAARELLNDAIRDARKSAAQIAGLKLKQRAA